MPRIDKRRSEPPAVEPAAAVPRRVARDTRRMLRLAPRRWGRLIGSSRGARIPLAIAIAAIWLPGLALEAHGKPLLTAMNLALTVAAVAIVLRVERLRRRPR